MHNDKGFGRPMKVIDCIDVSYFVCVFIKSSSRTTNFGIVDKQNSVNSRLFLESCFIRNLLYNFKSTF